MAEFSLIPNNSIVLFTWQSTETWGPCWNAKYRETSFGVRRGLYPTLRVEAPRKDVSYCYCDEDCIELNNVQHHHMYAYVVHSLLGDTIAPQKISINTCDVGEHERKLCLLRETKDGESRPPPV